MSKELKQCPFCGGAAYLDTFEYRGSVYEAVFCDECGIKGEGYPHEACDGKKLAIKAWNARKPIEQIVKHLKYAEKREYENACNRRNNNYEQSNGYVKGIRDAIDIVRNGCGECSEKESLIDYIAEHDVEILYALEHKDLTALEDALYEYLEK